MQIGSALGFASTIARAPTHVCKSACATVNTIENVVAMVCFANQPVDKLRTFPTLELLYQTRFPHELHRVIILVRYLSTVFVIADVGAACRRVLCLCRVSSKWLRTVCRIRACRNGSHSSDSCLLLGKPAPFILLPLAFSLLVLVLDRVNINIDNRRPVDPAVCAAWVLNECTKRSCMAPRQSALVRE